MCAREIVKKVHATCKAGFQNVFLIRSPTRSLKNRVWLLLQSKQTWSPLGLFITAFRSVVGGKDVNHWSAYKDLSKNLSKFLEENVAPVFSQSSDVSKARAI